MNKWLSNVVLAFALSIGLGAGSAIAADAPSGTFKFADLVKLVTLDPHKHTGGGIPYLTPVYESLFQRTPDDQIKPRLATGFDATGLKVNITLRNDVRFSDGEPFNADAVVANLTRAMELGVQRPLSALESVVATGEYSVEITLSRPSPSIIVSLAGIAGMMVSPKALDDPALDRNPVGTGPYLYNADQSREGEVRVYTINGSYWDPDAQGLERIEIWEMPDNTARLNALSTGQIDMGAWLSSPQALQVSKSDGLTLIRRPGGFTYTIIILDKDGGVIPAFADKRVRQAMSYAIDRQAFADVIQFGLATPAVQPVGAGHWAYNADLAGKYEYNPDKARKLLADAGYADGFSFTMPSIAVFLSRTEALAGFFADIGITMNIETIEPGTLARRSRTTDFPATNLVWVINTDLSNLPSLYLEPGAAFNPFKVAPSAKLNELAAKGAANFDLEMRAPAYREMFEVIADEAFLIYITSGQQLVGASDKIANNPTVVFSPGVFSPIWHGLRLNR